MVGLLTAALAWPRLIVGASEGPLEETLHSLSSADPAPDAAAKRILTIKEQSALAHGSAKIWADIGYLQLRESLQSGPSTADGKAMLDASINSHRKALTFDPRNAYVWTRLGQDLLVRDGSAADKIGFIVDTAVLFAPYDSRLVIARVDIALAVWDQLSDSTHDLIEPPPINESGSRVRLDRYWTSFKGEEHGEKALYGGADHRISAAG